MIPPLQTHQLEQFQALMRDLARAIGAYRQELREAGFSEAESYEMARAMENDVLGRGIADAGRILAEERRQRESLTKPPDAS